MITINIISTTPQSFHHLLHVGMINHSSALHLLLKKKFFLTNNKFIARDCLCDFSIHFFNLLFLWTYILLAYSWKVRQGRLGSVEIGKCLKVLRGKHTIHFRIFSALHNIPSHFNPVYELIRLQSALGEAMVHIHSYIWGKERSIEKNNMAYMNVYIMSVSSICYFRIPYPYLHFRNCFILKTISVLKQIHSSNI